MYINVNILMSEAQHIRFKIYVSEFDSHISGKSDTIKLDVLLKIIRVRKVKYFFRNSSKKYSNLSSYDKKNVTCFRHFNSICPNFKRTKSSIIIRHCCNDTHEAVEIFLKSRCCPRFTQ